MLNKNHLSSALLCSLLSSLFFNGCTYSTFYVPVERLVYNPGTPEAISVSSQKNISQPHKILGRVAAITWGGGESARSELQYQAALIGANMIIDLRIERGVGKTSASGLAILVSPGALK